MADHYHDPDDLKRLKDLRELAPAEFKGFVEFDKIVGREDGKIPRKYRELIDGLARSGARLGDLR
jgi:alkylhydroperoxidase/carboxymuconolactone decarboxylase family protein YurZ